MGNGFENELGQPVGKPLQDWRGAAPFEFLTLQGSHCRIVPLTLTHAPDLFEAHAHDTDGRNWTYLPYGPFETLAGYEAWLSGVVGKPDPAFMAIVSLETGKPVGVGSFMRINPEHGMIEIGHLNFSPLKQHTIIPSEALIMMIRHCLSLGNRRVE